MPNPNDANDDGLDGIAGDAARQSTIDLTPDSDGYAAIAAMFARSVVDDVKVSRRDAAGRMLVQVVEIAFHLGTVAARSEFDTAAEWTAHALEMRDRMTVRISAYLPR